MYRILSTHLHLHCIVCLMDILLLDRVRLFLLCLNTNPSWKELAIYFIPAEISRFPLHNENILTANTILEKQQQQTLALNNIGFKDFQLYVPDVINVKIFVILQIYCKSILPIKDIINSLSLRWTFIPL